MAKNEKDLSLDSRRNERKAAVNQSIPLSQLLVIECKTDEMTDLNIKYLFIAALIRNCEIKHYDIKVPLFNLTLQQRGNF